MAEIINRLMAVLAAIPVLAQRDGPTNARGIATELLIESGAAATEREAELRLQQTSRIISVVTIGAVSLVGLLVIGELSSQVSVPTDSPLDGLDDTLTSGFADAMSFVPIILIVLLAVVVIGVVRQM